MNVDSRLYLAQMSEGREAIQLYERAIEVLRQQLQSIASNNNAEETMICRRISSAFCSIAEIFMSDCW